MSKIELIPWTWISTELDLISASSNPWTKIMQNIKIIRRQIWYINYKFKINTINDKCVHFEFVIYTCIFHNDKKLIEQKTLIIYE